MNNHSEFIEKSISGILKDVVTASAGIGSGIETYPLCDYIMQSVFLKMTGFQEQKMKCICWELATSDYEYRRVLLADEDKLGECSSFKAKNAIYKRLVAKIDLLNDIDKRKILSETFSDIKNIFSGSNLSIWAQKSFNWFINHHINSIEIKHFANEKNLLENCLKYDLLYNHRNRCAHNTQSFQQNLPTLKTLADKNYLYENYFIRFAILILIDKIFIELYKRYLNALEDN
ncbi:MAG: hypothetical protein FWG79_02075 [Bacteroidales bacterium]|nr:hypothetical protein [Bacteroidales bacterium]